MLQQPTVEQLAQAAEAAWRAGDRLQSARLMAQLDPHVAADAEQQRNIAHILLDGGDLPLALRMYDRSLATDPGSVAAWTNRGNILQSQERLPEAIDSYQQALARDPQFAIAWNNLGTLYSKLGRLTDAESAYHAALRFDPELHDVRTNLATVASARGDMVVALQASREALVRRPNDCTALYNYLYFLNFTMAHTPEQIAAEHRQYGKHFQQLIAQSTNIRATTRAPRRDRPLRVGYVSPNLHFHSCAYFLEPIFRHHDRSCVSVYAYANMSRLDAMTARLQSYPVTWRNIFGRSTADACALIEQDEIDLLVDCAGYTEGNRLDIFACRPAPIQVTYLGYPNGTGLPAMDQRVVDLWTDPESADALATERLTRLPHGFLTFGWDLVQEQLGGARPDYTPTATIRFASFNNLSKTTPAVVACWADILHQVPGSTLLIKNHSFADDGTRAAYGRLFAEQGIAAGRVQCVGWDDDRTAHLLRYAAIDIALDTFPYNGTTTTCEALAMGVPVITLAGDRHGARVGVSLLNQIGCPQWIGATAADYVRIAVALANDRQALLRWHTTLPERMRTSPLCDGPRFAGDLETAYRAMANSWRGIGPA